MKPDQGCRGDLEFSTLPRLCAIAAERHGAAPAVVEGSVTLSYSELHAAVRKAARALVSLGVSPGERIAIWAPNVWEWAIAALGALSAGGVLVPINTRYKGAEAAYILEKSRATTLFTVRGFLDTDYPAMLRDFRAELPALRKIVLLRGDTSGDALDWTGFLEQGSVQHDTIVDARIAALGPDDLCDLQFTSGTTGHPKGVMCTHGQSLRAFRDWADIVGLRAGDRYLVVPPFFHTFGYKAGLLASLMVGATVLPHAVFEAGAVLSRIAEDDVHVVTGPPALYQSLLAHPKLPSTKLSSLRLAVTGAAVIPVELIHRMRQELGFETVLTAYGLTEGTGVATMCRRGDPPETIASTSGRAIPGLEVLVVDGAGLELPRGETGEVVIRGYTVTKGYFENESATAEAIDERGFLHTGDVGIMDGDGNLRITDRKKDMFIVGGFNAYPAEIEQALGRHPSVGQVAVVGMPDSRLGEVGVAFVVPRAGAAVNADELVAFCRERMANFKVPRRIAIVSELPMNASGKVQKFRLREQAKSLGEG
jgi:HIP---CoA ligase